MLPRPFGGGATANAGGLGRLEPGCYHKLTAPRGRVLLGEVSVVNDDVNDNRFHQPVGRFPEIEEDEPPWCLLVGDYAALAGGGAS